MLIVLFHFLHEKEFNYKSQVKPFFHLWKNDANVRYNIIK